MRILWWSNAPWVNSGYGQQTALFTPRIRDLGHQVTIGAFTGLQHCSSQWEGMDVLPGGLFGHTGMDVITHHYGNSKADVVIALMDAWALAPNVMALLNTVCWMPVDQAPLSDRNAEFLNASKALPVAIARYGQEALQAAGFDARYVPHGIDTSIFAPMDAAGRLAVRKAAGFGEDTFFVGINAMNRDTFRKGLDEQLCAFSRFHRRHPDSKLILHMAMESPQGMDMPAILTDLGIMDAAIFAPPGPYAAGEITAENLATGFYPVLDVLSACSMAEGFCLPLLEAQSCGVPVVTTGPCSDPLQGARGSAMPEVGKVGWLVESQPKRVEGHKAWWDTPLITSIDRAYEGAWQRRETGSLDVMRQAAREHALEYDVDRVVTQFWKPVLDEVEAAL